MSSSEAVLRGLAAVLVCTVGVVVLSLLEALWMLPARGLLSTFARARGQLQARSAIADVGAAVAGLLGALAGPAVGAALVVPMAFVASPATPAVAVAALLTIVPAPIFLALCVGGDERARLALHDALAAAARRGLALVAFVVVVDAAAASGPSLPGPALVTAIAAGVAVILVRGRHRGVVTLQPRFEDGLAGPALLAWRAADRAVVVVVAAVAAAGVYRAFSWWPVVIAVVVVVAVVGVLGARLLGPLRGEGLVGPVCLLVVAAVGRVAMTLALG